MGETAMPNNPQIPVPNSDEGVIASEGQVIAADLDESQQRVLALVLAFLDIELEIL